MTADYHNREFLEVNDEIDVENAEIGRFNIAVYIIISVICLVYLVTHLTR